MKLLLPDPYQMQAVKLTPELLGQPDTGTALLAAAACKKPAHEGFPQEPAKVRLGAALSHSNSQGLAQFLLLRQDQSHPSQPKQIC